MHRLISIVAVAGALVASVVIAVTAAASPQPRPSDGSSAPVTATVTADGSGLAADVLAARQATAKYAMNLARARVDGYRIITRMIPNMGYHFMNPAVTKFDVRRPAILVYEHHGKTWELGALEWVFTIMPTKAPLPGARYGVFGAACHYVDGTFVFADAQSRCAPRSPQTGSAFSFWHPRLITLHLWGWYPNPAGPYMGTNPLVALFNAG